MAARRGISNIHYESLKALNEISIWDRCCVITIINGTRYNLTYGQSALTSGEVHRAVPTTIKCREYGIILSRKASYSFKGAVGMVSYEVYDLKCDNHILQVGWHVPYDTTTYDIYFNAAFSNKMASTSELNKLIYDIPPEKRRRALEYTPGSFDIGDFRFEVAMSNVKQSMLTVQITDISNAEEEYNSNDVEWDYEPAQLN